MIVSLFGFLGNVMIDYNWGTNLIVVSLSVFYWMTLRWMIPFPLGYWGVGAVMYFMLFLLSFAVLNRKQPLLRNVLETVRLASGILILFEVGVFYFVPGFMDKWVINAVRYTPLSSFTNTDVLITAVGLFAVLEAVLIKSGSKRPPRL